MNSFRSSVKRKDLEEERIAICPQFSCKYIKRVKPLKFKFFGFGKYPKCKKHHLPLVFIDEFIGRFLTGVNACMFDISSLPPEDLLDQIKKEDPNGLSSFVNLWMYSNPFGRGIDLVSRYFDGLSNAYMKVLNRKQRKELKSNSDKKDRYRMLRQGMQRLVKEYTLFLKEFRFKSEELVKNIELEPLTMIFLPIIERWVKSELKDISKSNIKYDIVDYFNSKHYYDRVLSLRTASLIIGKKISDFRLDCSTFELFSLYYEYSLSNLCKELKKEDIDAFLMKFLESNVNFKNKFEPEIIPGDHSKPTKQSKNYNEIGSTVLEYSNLSQQESEIKEQIKAHLERVYKSISDYQKINDSILSNASNILDEFIVRLHNGEIQISNKTDFKAISAAILYTLSITSSNFPKIKISI